LMQTAMCMNQQFLVAMFGRRRSGSHV